MRPDWPVKIVVILRNTRNDVSYILPLKDYETFLAHLTSASGRYGMHELAYDKF